MVIAKLCWDLDTPQPYSSPYWLSLTPVSFHGMVLGPNKLPTGEAQVINLVALVKSLNEGAMERSLGP